MRYISPEQTGRVNRAVEFRSDLYSIGVLMYRTLLGTPPFESQDALEVMHAHLARIFRPRPMP